MQTKMEAKLRELISTLEAKGLEHVRLTAELENRSEHTVNWLLINEIVTSMKWGEEEMELFKQRCDGFFIAERQVQEFDRQWNDIKNKSRRRSEKKMTFEKKRLIDEKKKTGEGSLEEILSQQEEEEEEEEYEDELRRQWMAGGAASELKSERDNVPKLRTCFRSNKK